MSEPDPAGDDGSRWRDHRSEAARVHARGLERRRAAESAQARALIAAFVEEAQRRGIPPVRLRARSYDGQSRYRTSTLGWYLRRNESVAVGTDGAFYLCTVPSSVMAHLVGARLEPSDPPMVLGRGGRDGETIDLPDALAKALAAGEKHRDGGRSPA